MMMIFCSVISYYFSYTYIFYTYICTYTHVLMNLLKQCFKKEKLNIYFKKNICTYQIIDFIYDQHTD